MADLISLRDCPPGLFRFGETIGFKTEYRGMQTVGPIDIPGDQVRWVVGDHSDVYVVETGESFWAGAANRAARDAMLVEPIEFEPARLASVSSASAETLALQAIKVVTATAKDGAAGLSRIMAITNAAGVQAPYSELLQYPAVALIVERPRTEWAHLFKPDSKGCAIPPEGWQCSRARGHTGPCAASPEPVPATNQAVKWRERWYGSEPQKGSSIVDERGNLIAYFGGDETTHKATTAVVSAHNASIATQPATSQEGAAVNGLHPAPGHADGCGAHDDYACDCAATPTPPTLSEDLREALEASLGKRSVPTMDPVWSAAFNAALDMVARDTGLALAQVQAS